METEKKIDESFYTKNNFGKKGWLLIIFVGAMLFFSSGLLNDGLNVAVPQVATEKGWDYSTILAYSTPTGFLSVVGMFIITLLVDKKGVRFTTILCLIITGASYIWYGNAANQVQYFIALTLMSVCGVSAAWVCGGTYLAEYFPRKKGLALGWATMGNNACTACFVIILSGLISGLGSMGKAVIPLGIIIMLLAIITVFLPNTPEEAGLTPDAVPMQQDEIEAYRREANAYVSPWTPKKMLKVKETWLIILVLGFTMIMTVGIVSQLITRLTSEQIGWAQTRATMTMTVCALIGIIGSYVWGFIDQKISTKKAVAIFMIWFGVASLLNVVPNTVCLYISLFMIGVSLGGNANWPTSLTSSVFGYKNFTKFNTIISPLYTLLRCCAYFILAMFLSLTGTLTGAYILFGVMGFAGAVLTLFINDRKYADGTLGVLANSEK